MNMNAHPGNAKELWQGDSGTPVQMSAVAIKARVDRLARRTRLRNGGGLVVCGIVLIGCLWWVMSIDNPLARTGAVLTAVGICNMAFQLRSNQGGERAAVRRAAAMGSTPSALFHRGELERQRDFHRGRLLWIRLVLMVPGPLLFFAGFAQAHPEVAGTIRLEALAFALMWLAAVPLNLRLAGGYQRQLDELARLHKELS
jgi:hypothetical protein